MSVTQLLGAFGWREVRAHGGSLSSRVVHFEFHQLDRPEVADGDRAAFEPKRKMPTWEGGRSGTCMSPVWSSFIAQRPLNRRIMQ